MQQSVSGAIRVISESYVVLDDDCLREALWRICHSFKAALKSPSAPILCRHPQQIPGLRTHWLNLVKVLYVVMGDFSFYCISKIFKDLL
jgi:hypothetical protein